jgi:hypothetical protein
VWFSTLPAPGWSDPSAPCGKQLPARPTPPLWSERSWRIDLRALCRACICALPHPNMTDKMAEHKIDKMVFKET